MRNADVRTGDPLIQADRLARQGETDAAEDILRGIVADRPDDIPDNIEVLRSLLRLVELRSANANEAAELRQRIDRLDARHRMQLGRRLSEADFLEKAIRCFSSALDFDPDLADAHYFTADAYCGLERWADAIRSCKICLRLDPGHEMARYLLAALGAVNRSSRPPRMPDKVVVSVFDNYASHYDQHMIENLKYSTPQIMTQAMESAGIIGAAGGRAPVLDILDIGCGTGLMGRALSPYADRIDGIDLSPLMLEKAYGSGHYDRLIEGEVVAELQLLKRRYDVVVSTELLIYFGELSSLFGGVFQVLKPGGWFVCTTDLCPSGNYVLTRSGRFAHRPGHVRRIAEAAGFNVERIETRDDFRIECDKPNPGVLAILRK